MIRAAAVRMMRLSVHLTNVSFATTLDPDPARLHVITISDASFHLLLSSG